MSAVVAVSEGRRLLAIVVLLLAGFGMVALADALDEWWPLFVTPIPYAIIPWLIVRHERQVAAAAADTDLSTPTP